ncbi:MAG TPA: hypothetical protein VGI12_01675, partial [Vicinamibacterales bacterium]
GTAEDRRGSIGSPEGLRYSIGSPEGLRYSIGSPEGLRDGHGQARGPAPQHPAGSAARRHKVCATLSRQCRPLKSFSPTGASN